MNAGFWKWVAGGMAGLALALGMAFVSYAETNNQDSREIASLEQQVENQTQAIANVTATLSTQSQVLSGIEIQVAQLRQQVIDDQAKRGF